MKAMILAAGRGTRMGKDSLSIPKPLTKVNKKTLIEINIKKIKDAGIKDIIINVSWLGDQIIEYLGDGKKFGVNLIYSNESQKLLGTGGGINNALKLIGSKPFWLINSDVYSTYKINKDFKLEKGKLCHLILVKNPPHNKTGDFNLEGNKIIYNKDEKNYTFSGISVLSPKIFAYRKNKVFALEPLLKNLAKKYKVTGEYYDNFWIDVGTKRRLGILKKFLK